MIVYFSPVSREVVDAVLRAVGRGRRVGLCCTLRQVGPDSYTGLRREDVREWSKHLPVERDHLGRGEEDPLTELDRDVSAGFTGVHVHSSRMSPRALELAKEARDKGLEVQLGPGEDDSESLDLWELLDLQTEWFSFPAGPRIHGLENSCVIDLKQVTTMRRLLDSKTRLRLHNADYMPDSHLITVSRLFDGINVGPQLGAVQTATYLQYALSRGLPTSAWECRCRDDETQKKRWKCRDALVLPMLGHYHFGYLSWRQEAENEVAYELDRTIDRICERSA